MPPHPHIGLATVTYLFDGAMVHRDSTGAVQTIEPGGVNWMTAGSGVAHSERSPDEARPVTSPLAGLQTWVALPDESEEVAPSFEHAAAADLPAVSDGGVAVRLLVGTGFGAASPVAGASPLFHADVQLDAGARFALPAEHAERAVLVIDGDVEVAGERDRAAPPRRRRAGRRRGARRRAVAGDDVRRRARRAPLHLVELRVVDPRSASRRPRPTGPPAGSRRSPGRPSESSCRRAEPAAGRRSGQRGVDGAEDAMGPVVADRPLTHAVHDVGHRHALVDVVDDERPAPAAPVADPLVRRDRRREAS